MWPILAAAAALGAGAAEPVAPAPPAAVTDGRFAMMDRDGNGVITGNEAPRAPRTRCDCLAGTADWPAPSWIQLYDRDGDLRVTPQELAAGALPILIRAGADAGASGR